MRIDTTMISICMTGMRLWELGLSVRFGSTLSGPTGGSTGQHFSRNHYYNNQHPTTERNWNTTKIVKFVHVERLFTIKVDWNRSWNTCLESFVHIGSSVAQLAMD